MFKSDRVEQKVVYDSSAQKHAIFFKDVFDSGKGKGIVATVSGNSVSYGTAAVFDTSGSAERYGAVYDTSNSKIALGFDNGSDGKYIAGTISEPHFVWLTRHAPTLAKPTICRLFSTTSKTK